MSAESGRTGLRIVGWMTERDRDESFPRLHKHEADAAYWVGVCTLPPRVTMRPVYAIDPCSSDPVRAALVEALRKCKTCALPTEVRELVNAALRAAGVVL